MTETTRRPGAGPAGRAAALAGLPGPFEPFVVGAALDDADELQAAAESLGGRWIDAQKTASQPFLDRLQRLDGHVNASVGRALPRWAFYDCAEIPGWIAGLSLPPAALPPRARDVMGLDAGDAGVVPVSMICVVPLASPGAWHTYSIGGLDLPEHAALCRATLALGLHLVGDGSVYVATPWRAPRLAVYAWLAPLELVTAWTPAHSEPATLTARFDVTAERLGRLVSTAAPEPADASRWIEVADEPAQRELQSALEQGCRYVILAPPRREGDRLLVPVREGGAS